MKREDIKVGKIYKYTFTDGDYNIFRATKDLLKCNSLVTSNSRFVINSNYTGCQDRITETTQEQKEWFEHCERFGEYRPIEEALENMQLKEFIKENNLV